MSASPRQAEALLRRLEWTVVRRLDGLLQGDYRTLFRGAGLDFADLREYQVYDDVRHIDWNVTARTQMPHVRIYNEDRDVTAWFLLDLSPSVDFGSGEKDKRQVLTEFVGVLARLFTQHGNKVGAILFDGVDEHLVPARSGRRHVMYLMDKILAHPRRLRAPATDLGAFFHRAGAVLKRRSVVFAISDFVSRPGWEAPLSMLSRRHETVAVRLVDPLEVALPDIGLLAFEDAETGEQVFVDTTDAGFRKRFAAGAQRWEEQIVGGLAQAGVDTLELSTADDLLDAILRFSGMRKAGAGGTLPGVPA
ncbi:MAG TPA: DUF58 domain-containing protein [Devosia sp.]|jgi:uncharacterized protein (DUF58 family)|nr:DUF58 domain-containing protein [Devosia sp.]